MTDVALIHGFTQTGRSWAPIAERLMTDGHDVVAPDLPGHGASSQLELDLAGTADHLGRVCGPAAYVGYSLGGRVCLHVALRHPALTRRLVVIGATGGIDDPVERAARRQADAQLAVELDALGDASVRPFVERWLANPLFATLSPEAANIEARLANTAGGLASSLRLAGTGAQRPLWDRLGALDMPVLVVAGELDAKFTAAGERLVAAIGANATLALIPAAGHAAHLEQPDAFAAALEAFLG
jgi:2-succinyl-6-hydroxy-2,4-cyclohexadiene-1-carboxylate synthase